MKNYSETLSSAINHPNRHLLYIQSPSDLITSHFETDPKFGSTDPSEHNTLETLWVVSDQTSYNNSALIKDSSAVWWVSVMMGFHDIVCLRDCCTIPPFELCFHSVTMPTLCSYRDVVYHMYH